SIWTSQRKHQPPRDGDPIVYKFYKSGDVKSSSFLYFSPIIKGILSGTTETVYWSLETYISLMRQVGFKSIQQSRTVYDKSALRDPEDESLLKKESIRVTVLLASPHEQ